MVPQLVCLGGETQGLDRVSSAACTWETLIKQCLLSVTSFFTAGWALLMQFLRNSARESSPLSFVASTDNDRNWAKTRGCLTEKLKGSGCRR